MALPASSDSAEPSPGGTLEVLGTPLQCTSYGRYIEYCVWRSKQPDPFAIDFSNTHIVTLRRHDPAFREITSRFDAFIPDGMPLIWALNARGASLKDRVYGPTFMRRCILEAPTSTTHYFLGASSECLEKLTAFFRTANPSVQIIGSHHGYFKQLDEPAIVQAINELSPDFIWIGLGTPKQQDFIHRNKASFARGLLLAVGFAFDVNAGTKKDAPAWMQRIGLTWLYRLLEEPKRLGSRYLKFNSLFLWYLIRDALLKRK